jgi:heme exporter protein B
MAAIILQRELLLRLKTPSSWLYAVVFFAMVMVLFPLALGVSPVLLHQIGAAAVWIAALLAVLLGMDSLFRVDVEDGSLEQVIVARQSLALWALLKVAVHWLSGGLIMTLLSLLSMPLFGLSGPEAGLLALTLLLGTPILTLFAALAAALTVSLRSGAMYVPLIALPLQLPVLIFATGALDLLQRGETVLPILALLAAGLILVLIFIPFAIAGALRLAL